ncbi:MAG: TIGR00730 family Rossman fold protein [Elusimicrobiaceae bacterium]|nr:TIGR00730 family Rossman fold protein [Elusimicrobiaceae bacterium]
MKKINPAKQHPTSYIKAYEDIPLLKHADLRPVRMELETLKPEIYFRKNGVTETIICFGSARIPQPKAAKAQLAAAQKLLAKKPKDKKLQEQVQIAQGHLKLSKYYDEAREFAKLVVKREGKRFSIVTGGGPGIMEAANRGAFENGGRSIGLNITLPHEQEPNPYISKNLAFLFHYFAIRKIHFVMRAKACVVFPGGFGTFDELFEILTLIQTGKKSHIPVILVGKEFWSQVINVKALASFGMISPKDTDLCPIVETAQEAWDIIAKYYKLKK